MKTHQLFLKMPYLKMIKNGNKTLEARANYPNLRKIEVGDEITFVSGNLSITTIVKRVCLYTNVVEILKTEVINDLIPNASYLEAQHIYNSIYAPEKVEKNGGMLVFEVQVI